MTATTETRLQDALVTTTREAMPRKRRKQRKQRKQRLRDALVRGR